MIALDSKRTRMQLTFAVFLDEYDSQRTACIFPPTIPFYTHPAILKNKSRSMICLLLHEHHVIINQGSENCLRILK